MIVNFNNIGSVGVVDDLPSYQLPLDAWSSATNVRFNDGYAEKFKGQSEPYGTPSVAPYFVLPVQSETVQYWMYAGLTSVYVTQGTAQTDISNGTHQANGDNTWNGGILGTIAVITNGEDPPQFWETPSPSVSLADLSNWPASTKCKVIKPYKNYLVAMDVTKPSGRFPQLVKWSHPADPGAVPDSWDEADTTKDAGETTLSQDGGYILDGHVMGDVFVIYRERSIWEMRFIGGKFIFQFRELFGDVGALATHCVAEFEGKHLVLTANDLMVHDGRNIQSVADKKQRDTLFADIDTTNAKRTFLAPNHQKNEIWICYPETGQTFATKALVWNYRHNTFGYRALPGARHIGFGVVDATALGTIDAHTDTIDSYTDTYDKVLYDSSKSRMLIADTTNTLLLQADDTNQFNGVNFTSTLQRTGINLDNDMASVVRIKRILPKIEAANGTEVGVKVGYQSVPEGAVNWSSSNTFTVGTDYKIDISNDNNVGRLLAIEYQTTGDVAWKLHGFDLDVEKAGKR
jgi:hypothetical protein